jgi:hypothetical protein
MNYVFGVPTAKNVYYHVTQVLPWFWNHYVRRRPIGNLPPLYRCRGMQQREEKNVLQNGKAENRVQTQPADQDQPSPSPMPTTRIPRRPVPSSPGRELGQTQHVRDLYDPALMYEKLRRTELRLLVVLGFNVVVFWVSFTYALMQNLALDACPLCTATVRFTYGMLGTCLLLVLIRTTAISKISTGSSKNRADKFSRTFQTWLELADAVKNTKRRIMASLQVWCRSRVCAGYRRLEWTCVSHQLYPFSTRTFD